MKKDWLRLLLEVFLIFLEVGNATWRGGEGVERRWQPKRKRGGTKREKEEGEIKEEREGREKE